MSSATRILLVEDELDIRMAGQIQFRSMGYHVDTAVNGIEALSQLRQKTYDVVLMDTRMPKMDGLTAIAHMQADPELRPIPVIVVSASPGDQNHALDNGARFFIRKPFVAATVANAIESVSTRV